MALATINSARVVLPILASFAGGSLYGWSGYAPAVRAHFDASHAAISMVFSVALVSFTIGVLIGPIVLARLPGRVRLGVLALMAVLGLSISAAGPNLGVFLIGYGVVFGFASGALYNDAISRMSQTGRPALFVPVCVAGFGLGGAVFGSANLWLGAHGFGLWSSLPALVCLLAVAVAVTLPGISDGPSEPAASQLSFTLPDRDIVVLWVIFACGCVPGLIVLGFATQFVPGGAQAVPLAGLAVLLAAAGNTTGRLAAGAVATLYGARRGIVVSLCLSVLALLVLILAASPATILAALLGAALAYGVLAATMPLMVRSMVSAAAFPTAFGWVFTGWGAAGLLGPWGAGWLLDRTGDLTIALGVSAAFGVTALALIGRYFGKTTSDDPAPYGSRREG